MEERGEFPFGDVVATSSASLDINFSESLACFALMILVLLCIINIPALDEPLFAFASVHYAKDFFFEKFWLNFTLDKVRLG